MAGTRPQCKEPPRHSHEADNKRETPIRMATNPMPGNHFDDLQCMPAPVGIRPIECCRVKLSPVDEEMVTS